MRIIKVILFLMKKVQPSFTCLIWVRKRRQNKCIMNYLSMRIEIYKRQNEYEKMAKKIYYMFDDCICIYEWDFLYK